MKTKEELNAIKEEVENESRKPHELTEEDLEQVTGGGPPKFEDLNIDSSIKGFSYTDILITHY